MRCLAARVRARAARRSSPCGTPPSYVDGHFLLKLDAVNAGFIKSMDGGAIHADVITEPVGPR
jgi:hypothetical protein